jgi:Uma2 family endonuclease
MSANEDRPDSVEAVTSPPGEEGNGAVAAPAPSGRGPLLELAPEDYPDVSNLITEDGAPVDSIYVDKQYTLLTDPLESSWKGPGDGGRFVTLTNVGLFYAARNPALVPDFLLSLGVTYPEELLKKEHQSYFVWLFGKGPDVVGEIVSDRRGGEDTLRLKEYARQGIRYYFIFDPKDRLGGGVLRVYGLHHEGYGLIPDNKLPAIGLSLTLWEGSYVGVHTRWLRWCDRDGRLLPTGAELAEQERQRAEQERLRADESAERIKRLEAQLRAQGVEPSS